MIIFRYLAREVFVTLASLTTILLLVFLSNQLIQYLNRAASGSIPGVIIMKLMMLELPTLLSLLIPLGFYIALLLAYGRLYAENEMTVLRASGYSAAQLLKHSFIISSLIALFVAIIMIWGTPYIYVERAKLLRSTGIQTLVQTIMPGRFHAIQNGQQVFYVQSMSRDHRQAEHVFLAKQAKKEAGVFWDVLWAEKANAATDDKTFEDYIVLKKGQAYQGIPGHQDFRTSQFAEYQARLPHPKINIQDDLRTAKTSSLWPINNADRAKAAELQWRLSIPLMVLTLTLVAVPLSRVNSRSGKYAQLLPAIVIYIIYANLMFVGRNGIHSGAIPQWLGLWWIHGLILLLGLLLIWRNHIKLS